MLFDVADEESLLQAADGVSWREETVVSVAGTNRQGDEERLDVGSCRRRPHLRHRFRRRPHPRNSRLLRSVRLSSVRP